MNFKFKIFSFALFSFILHNLKIAIAYTELNVKSTILGAVIGDALGRETEFVENVDSIKQIFGINGLTNFNNKKYKLIDGKALYTDDTVMSLIVLEEAIKARKNAVLSGSVDENNFIEQCAVRFAELFGSKSLELDPYYYYRAHGPTNINNCKSYIKNKQILGSKWWQRGDSNIYDKILDLNVLKEGGCGSVMRVWPIGLIFYDDLELVIRLADEQSKITHRNPMARAACVAMAVGMAMAIRGETVDEIYKQMVKSAERYEIAEKIYKPKATKILNDNFLNSKLISEDKILTSDMLKYAYKMAKSDVHPKNVLGINNDKFGFDKGCRSTNGALLGWAADEAIAGALYTFICHPSDFNAALIKSVNTPGDSDSIATLASALVGCKSNLNGFDYSKLENVNKITEITKEAYNVMKNPIGKADIFK